MAKHHESLAVLTRPARFSPCSHCGLTFCPRALLIPPANPLQCANARSTTRALAIKTQRPEKAIAPSGTGAARKQENSPMPSPFPGMDPYLEHPKLWPAFQHQLLACLYQILLPGLVDRYRARVGTRTYVSETPLFTSIIREQYSEEFIEIRTRTDGNLVPLLEVVSPANKTTPAGRQAYLDARQQAVHQKAGVVEIDLVMQGKPTLTYSRDGLPEYDYAVTVTRSNAPDRYEIYTATLQKRLPKFKLPL